MDELDELIKEGFRDWEIESWDEIPRVEGYDCVKIVRKTRDMLYKKENGLPYHEEETYLNEMTRRADEALENHIRRKRAMKKELVCA